jgi:Protein of unknown function (DUF3300)
MRRWIQNIPARKALVVLAVVLAAPPLPQAQQPGTQAQQPESQAQPTGGQAQEPEGDQLPPFKPEELEQIVAPIALYPDALVAQVMMASTYPLEVIQAARLVKANPKLKDTALNEELKKYDWDDSVKSLASFPQVLALMDEKIDWMQKLGDAFLGQRKETMDAIQRLRVKAQAEGNLKSNEQQKVIVEQAEPQPGQPAPTQQTIVKIEPTNPQVIYVPSYNPTVVYGAWPPAYPPYYPYPPGYAWGAAAVSFGVGMAVGAAVWGGANWGGGDVDIDVNKNNNFTNTVNRGDRATQIKNERASQGGQRGQGQGAGNKQSWNHNPEHRKGAQYRDAGSQQKYNRANSPQAGTRDAYRGREGAGGAQRGGPQAGTRESGPGAGGGGQRGGPQAGTRESGVGGAGGGERGGPQAGTRESGGGSAGGAQRGGGGREAGAFEGMGSGRDQGSYSQRGQSSSGASRASGYSGGGSRGGGGASHSGGSRGGGGGSRGGGGRGGGGRR